MSEEKQLSLEETFAQLETVIEQLEKPDTPLESAFLSYKQGMDLVAQCNGMIDKVEKEVRILSEGGEEDGEF